MHKITEIEALEKYRLRLRFEDGTVGDVDLSNLAGRGVFAPWTSQDVFRHVRIGEHGELEWSCGVDLCPDSLYLRITGKNPKNEFSLIEDEPAYA